MLKATRAVTDRNGILRFLSPIKLPKSRRVIITILDDEASDEMTDPDRFRTSLALLSESALAKDWERPEEDEAWSHLAQLPSL
jgi:hypothetical protein